MPTKGMLSFDRGGGFDLPDEQQQFTLKLRRLEKLRRDAERTNRYRDRRTNLAKGGQAYSQHRIGLAADYVFADMSAESEQVKSFLRDARSVGLIPVDETKVTQGTGPHVHVQAYPAGPKGKPSPMIPARVFDETP